MINKVTLIGNVGKEPVVNYSPSGTAVLKFSLATNENYKEGDEWKQRTEWHNIVAFGKLADSFKTTKGNVVYVDGKISTSNYEKDGVKHYRTDIIANILKNITKVEQASDDELPN